MVNSDYTGRRPDAAVTEPAVHCTGTRRPPRRHPRAADRRCSSSGARSRRSSTSRSCCRRFPQLIARLTKFQAFAVYLLDPQARRAARSPTRSATREDVARTLRVKVGQGLVGAAVAEGQPILVNDVHADPRYVEAVPGSNAELVVPLRRKGRVIGALNLLSDTDGPVHRDRRGDAAAVRRARRRRDRERAAVRARARVHQHARDAGGDRPRVRRDPQPRRAADAHRQPDPARSSTTAPSASCCSTKRRSELEMKVAVRYGDKVTRAAREARRRPRRLRGAAQGAGARAGRVAGSALHQGRRRRAVGAGDSADAARIAASASSISRARSSTPSRRATSRS